MRYFAPSRFRFQRSPLLMPVTGAGKDLAGRVDLDLIGNADGRGIQVVQVSPDMGRDEFRKQKIVGVKIGNEGAFGLSEDR